MDKNKLYNRIKYKQMQVVLHNADKHLTYPE